MSTNITVTELSGVKTHLTNIDLNQSVKELKEKIAVIRNRNPTDFRLVAKDNVRLTDDATLASYKIDGWLILLWR
jgi:hypothetical protein